MCAQDRKGEGEMTMEIRRGREREGEGEGERERERGFYTLQSFPRPHTCTCYSD